MPTKIDYVTSNFVEPTLSERLHTRGPDFQITLPLLCVTESPLDVFLHLYSGHHIAGIDEIALPKPISGNGGLGFMLTSFPYAGINGTCLSVPAIDGSTLIHRSQQMTQSECVQILLDSIQPTPLRKRPLNPNEAKVYHVLLKTLGHRTTIGELVQASTPPDYYDPITNPPFITAPHDIPEMHVVGRGRAGRK
jgi:hypothetical protein